jgi:hypothetical protein
MKGIFTSIAICFACLGYAQKAKIDTKPKLDTVPGTYETINKSGQKVKVPCFYICTKVGHVRKILSVYFVDATAPTRIKPLAPVHFEY